MSGNQTFIDPPEPGSEQAASSGGRAAERKTMAFSFDKSYWSAGDRSDPDYCSQETLYDDLGKELLDHGFSGFNACILACECFFFCNNLANFEIFLSFLSVSRWSDRYVGFSICSASST